MAQIQRNFRRHQQLGLPGQVAHPNEPYAFDQDQAEVALRPGMGVLRDATSNKFALPTTDAEELLVTHIVGFDSSSFNADIASPTTNQASRVEFAADAIVKAMAYGTMVVIAGATVKAGDLARYDRTNEKWETYTPADVTNVAAFRQASFEFLTAGEDGDPVIVRHHGRIKF